jgi:hypothetical protein
MDLKKSLDFDMFEGDFGGVPGDLIDIISIKFF